MCPRYLKAEARRYRSVIQLEMFICTITVISHAFAYFSLICILRKFKNDKWNYLSLNVVALLESCL